VLPCWTVGVGDDSQSLVVAAPFSSAGPRFASEARSVCLVCSECFLELHYCELANRGLANG
jgi:hypothetical protein